MWFKQEQREKRLNQGVRGAHASIAFQCEECWILNLEGRHVIEGLDDTYRMLIRRANLDAMSGRAVSTIHSHAASIQRTARNCKLIGKTPSIPVRGPMPIKDQVGMGVAVEMLFLSITAKGRLKDDIQYDTMRKPRATHSKCYESSPQGVAEGSSFAKGIAKSTLTLCPTQSEWFSMFSLGAESRMGYFSEANKPLNVKVILKVLDMIKSEAARQPEHVSFEMLKVGVAIVVGLCGSLRGPEIFMLDLAGVREILHRGKDGVMPSRDPLKAGVDLSNVPHIHLALMGQVKGEHGVRQHLVAIASKTKSGIDARWWIEKLVDVREAEGFTSGPAFGHSDGSVSTISEYDGVLRHFLKRIQSEPGSDLLDEKDEVDKFYSFFRTFRKTAENRARVAGLGEDIQNAMNRWKKIEAARGKRPRFNMIEHYSDARELMPVTWKYSYVQ